MVKGKGGHLYDEDDFYDEEYDYEDYDEEPAEKKAPVAPAAKGKGVAAAAPAAAAGASKLAQYICDPPPLRQNCKPQKGARKDPAAAAKHAALATPAAARKLVQPPPPAPPNHATVAGPSTSSSNSSSKAKGGGGAVAVAAPPFKFDTPSPDDRVLTAQQSSNIGLQRKPPPGFATLPQVLLNVADQRANKSVTTAANNATPSTPTTSGGASTPAPFAKERTADAVLAMFGLGLGSGDRRQPAGNHAGKVIDEGQDADGQLAGQGQAAVKHGQPAGQQASGSTAEAAFAASLGAQPPASGSHEASSAAGPRRKVSDYVMEADLARMCDAAAAAERPANSSSSAVASTSGQTQARERLHLVVLGHVDAGKSTLMGRLLHDLGHVSQKEAHKNQKEATQAGKGSFAWAWVLDERPEERERGITVDVAVSRFATERFAVTLLDAPGHRDFVPNMISGAAQADAALLVVDGSPGGFESGFEGTGGAESGGQTKEHAQLARSLGIDQLAVVVTKLDACEYSQERFEAIRAVLEPFLTGVGFRASLLQWLPAVAVGTASQNLTQPPTEPGLRSWWGGVTLVQAIDTFSPHDRETAKPFRMPISDVFKSRTGSTAVGGKLEGGAIRPGGKVLLVPSYTTTTIRSIEVDGQAIDLARAGDSADVFLAGADALPISGGAVLCHVDYPIPFVAKFEARVLVLDVPIPLMPGAQVTVHAHTARRAGRVSSLLQLINAKTGAVLRAKPRCVTKGQAAVVEVTLERPMCLEAFADYRALGRIALRDCGRTIAVGVVLQVIS